jgi:hypothetical protein
MPTWPKKTIKQLDAMLNELAAKPWSSEVRLYLQDQHTPELAGASPSPTRLDSEISQSPAAIFDVEQVMKLVAAHPISNSLVQIRAFCREMEDGRVTRNLLLMTACGSKRPVVYSGAALIQSMQLCSAMGAAEYELALSTAKELLGTLKTLYECIHSFVELNLLQEKLGNPDREGAEKESDINMMEDARMLLARIPNCIFRLAATAARDLHGTLRILYEYIHSFVETSALKKFVDAARPHLCVIGPYVWLRKFERRRNSSSSSSRRFHGRSSMP